MASRSRPTRKTETVFTNKTQANNNNLLSARSLAMTRGDPTLPSATSLRPPSYGTAVNLKPVSPSRPTKLSPTAMAANQSRRKKDAKVRRLQASVYDFLERPKDYKSVGYQLVMFLMALLCLLLSVLATVDKYERRASDLLIGLEVMMVIWFTVEFALRVWSAGCRSRYQNLPGRLQFFKRPLCLLDVIVILSSMTILCIRSEGQIFTSSALGGLRFFQILRMLRIDRRGGSWKLLGSVIWAHRQELFTTLYIGFLGLIFFSFLIYIVEKDKNPARFGTYPDALWWGVVTLCTVGYGDAVPVTWLGKLVASCCALLGISFFALPAGILGSGFALKVQQQQRQKHLTRRKGPAAILIQSLWRCHAAEESFNSTATWMVHVQRLSPKTNVISANSSCQKFRMNSSFISRLSIRRKEGYSGGHHSSSSNNNNNSTSATNNNNNNNNNNISATQQQQQQPPEEGRRNLIRRTYSGNNAEPSSRYALVNARLKLKRSHISFQDVVVLQSSPIGDRKEAEGDVKNDDNNEDALQCARVDHLTSTHKTAIRAIRKIKFFVARRIFKEALKPYDVKDVIEQYTAGHLDMLTRVKDLQTRLDLIVGHSGSTSPEVSEGRLSMASRIIKIEKQVSCIESKLDTLVEMHRNIRGESSIHTRTDSLPSNQSSECNDAEPPTSGRRLFGLSHFPTRYGSKQHHERAYKQLSEPLSSSESMRKEPHLTVGQYNSTKRSAELSSDRLHFLGSQQSIEPSADGSNKLRWRQNAPLEAFDSHDIIRSEIMLNRLPQFDTDEQPNSNQLENKKRRMVDNQDQLDPFPATIKSSSNAMEETCVERQTLYTLSEHTSATSNTWSHSGTASTDLDLCKTETKECDMKSTYSTPYQSEYRVISSEGRSSSRKGRENEGLSLEPERSTPDIIETNEYEPLLPDSQDSLEHVDCNLIRNKCCPYLDASKHHGRHNGESKSGQNKLAAIPLLDPLFVESSLSNQCPSIFLTMPSNERISSVEDGVNSRESLLEEPEKRLATISRSISALWYSKEVNKAVFEHCRAEI
uniref:Putative potassium voltage-gated channel subfamily KQT 3 n=1 Tax=Hirudo verbana TaxID=311461 RepID=A0A2S1WM22_9ANNE|nr:putative potassium voltage-gated channel subfamily KQT 3 [Hirudo verbana]